MTLEACLLILLMSTFYLTSLVGIDSSCEDVAELASPLVNQTLLVSDCVSPPTSTLTKAVYAIWVWAIYFTFPGRTYLHSLQHVPCLSHVSPLPPGTYSTQPAVTVQTFGHKYGGFIYAFLFSGDIINNLITALMSRVGIIIINYQTSLF